MVAFVAQTNKTLKNLLLDFRKTNKQKPTLNSIVPRTIGPFHFYFWNKRRVLILEFVEESQGAVGGM